MAECKVCCCQPGCLALTMAGEPATPDRQTRGEILLHRILRIATIALAALAASFALWDPLDIDERKHVKNLTLHSVRSVKADLEADMQSRMLAQVRLANLWATHVPPSEEDWRLSAELFLQHHRSYLFVQWIDPDQIVRSTVEREPGAAASAASGRLRLSQLLREAARQPHGEPRIYHVPEFGDGQRIIIVPVRTPQSLAGFVVAMFEIKRALGDMLHDHGELGYSLSIREAGSEIYVSRYADKAVQETWGQEAEVALPGAIWQVRAWPNPETLADMRSSLPELALVFGALLGMMLMTTMHFARAAQQRAKEIRVARDELEDRVQQRTMELRRANELLQDEVGERRKAEDSLQMLSRRLMRLQDEERRRIARELHDSTAQLLGAIKINLDESLRVIGGDSNISGKLQDSGELLQRALQELRTITYLLHPPMLDELGVEYVLPWYAEGFGKRSGIQVKLHVEPDIGRLPNDFELALFRITQEALANVHHHSGSKTVSVSLSLANGKVVLEVCDQGRGIPPDLLKHRYEKADFGVGLAGMKERVYQLGGSLEIQSDKSGTVVRACLPYKPANIAKGKCAS